MVKEEKFEDCIKKNLDKFYTYDLTVDVVSCLQSFFEFSYEKIFNNFYFDRFPKIKLKEEDKFITPDFTVCFNEEYGIIFEVIRTTGKNREAIEKTLSQLKEYDRDIYFKTNTDIVIPSTQDIVLLVAQEDASQIILRLEKILKEKNIIFDHNLIFVEYNLNIQDRKARYVFKQVLKSGDNFRDDELPQEAKLKRIGPDGEYDSIKCYPKYFLKIKAREVFCNDPPTPLYIITYLWNKVFPHYLSEDQKGEWKKQNSSKILLIELDVDSLSKKLYEDFIPNYKVRKEDVRRALVFLEKADLAKNVNSDTFEINFRNINTLIRKKNDADNLESVEDFKETARIIAERFCKKASKSDITIALDFKESSVDKQETQKTLTKD